MDFVFYLISIYIMQAGLVFVQKYFMAYISKNDPGTPSVKDTQCP